MYSPFHGNIAKNLIVKKLKSELFRYFSLTKNSEHRGAYKSSSDESIIEINPNSEYSKQFRLTGELIINLECVYGSIVGPINSEIIVYYVDDNGIEKITTVIGLPNKLIFGHPIVPQVNSLKSIYDYLSLEISFNETHIDNKNIKISVSVSNFNNSFPFPLNDIKSRLKISSFSGNSLLHVNEISPSEIKKSSDSIKFEFYYPIYNDPLPDEVTFFPQLILDITPQHSQEYPELQFVEMISYSNLIFLNNTIYTLKLAKDLKIDISDFEKGSITVGFFGQETELVEQITQLKGIGKAIVEDILKRIHLDTQNVPGYSMSLNDLIKNGVSLRNVFFKNSMNLEEIFLTQKIESLIIKSKFRHIIPFEIFAYDANNKESFWGLSHAIAWFGPFKNKDVASISGDYPLSLPIKVLLIFSRITIPTKSFSQKQDFVQSIDNEEKKLESIFLNNSNIFDVTIIDIDEHGELDIYSTISGPDVYESGLTNKERILGELKQGYDIIHISGESNFVIEKNKSNNERILHGIKLLVDSDTKSDDKNIFPNDIYEVFSTISGKGHNLPVIFFANFCNSVFYEFLPVLYKFNLPSPLSDETFYRKLSFNAAIAPFVGAYIGTFIFIPTDVANAFSRDFYKMLFDPIINGNNDVTDEIPKIVRSVKRKIHSILLKHNSPEISHLTYALFGHPKLRLKIER